MGFQNHTKTHIYLWSTEFGFNCESSFDHQYFRFELWYLVHIFGT